jgi:preprotein translocase subunit SecE
MSIFTRITNFLKETRVELKKVNWPTRKETVKYTLIVIGLSFAVALFLGGLDFLFTLLITKFLI